MSWSFPLVSECFSRGVVGAMNLTMTVRAAMVESENVKTGSVLVAPQRVHVARLAKESGSSLEEAQIVRAVRHVADIAIFAYGRMLPEEGSASFGMAFVAELCGRTGYQHGLAFTAVGVVARSAGDFR